jgi:RNA polymerase sigma factor (sigma-70 family)
VLVSAEPLSPRLEANEGPAAAAAADERAALIARLFREHNEALVRFLALRLRSQQEAREVAQEAYVRVLNLEQPGAVGFLRAFLFKTATNLAVDRIRHRQTVERVTREGRFWEELAGGPSAEQSAASAEELALAERLMNQLPPKCRRALLLHKIYGLEFSEIARQMGLKERMVRRYVERALVYCRAGLNAARSEESIHG